MRLILILYLFAAPAFGFTVESSNNEIQEQQARSLFHEIRCLVCSGESIADSKADLAKQLRNTIRQQLDDGKTPNNIKAYLVERYGHEILMEPPILPHTTLLWFLPFILIFGVMFAFILVLRTQRT